MIQINYFQSAAQRAKTRSCGAFREFQKTFRGRPAILDSYQILPNFMGIECAANCRRGSHSLVAIGGWKSNFLFYWESFR
jgi:hypothetical protein